MAGHGQGREVVGRRWSAREGREKSTFFVGVDVEGRALVGALTMRVQVFPSLGHDGT